MKLESMCSIGPVVERLRIMFVTTSELEYDLYALTQRTLQPIAQPHQRHQGQNNCRPELFQ